MAKVKRSSSFRRLRIANSRFRNLNFETVESRLPFTASPFVDLAENNASEWQTFATDGQPATVADDATHLKFGTSSLKFVTESGFDTGVAYPNAASAHWDVSSKNYLTFWTYAENENAFGFQGSQPIVVLKTAGGEIRYEPHTMALSNHSWARIRIPLDGGQFWTRIDTGTPTLTDVNQLEIHADTWDYGFTIYFDRMVFEQLDPNALPPAGPAPPAGVNADALHPKVLVFAYDPIMEDKGGLRQHEVYGGSDPTMLAANMVSDLRSSSHGLVDYEIVETVIADQYPYLQDGFQYDDSSYDTAIQTGVFHNSRFDYLRFINDNGIVQRIESGEIDEVWMYTGNTDAAQTWESTMAGDGAYWCNSPPVQGVDSRRMFVVMGLNFERGTAEEIHSFGHRTESIMDHMYGSQAPNLDNNWNRFTYQDRYQAGSGGVGNVHFPVNGTGDYDYDNRTLVSSNADDWQNYPNFTGSTRQINSDEWSPTHFDAQRDYLNWWYSHIPHFSGRGPDFYLTNWWRYIVDVDQFKASNGNLFLSDGIPEVQTDVLGDAPFDSSVEIRATVEVDGALGRVDFYIDGVFKGSDDLAPFTFPWDTTGLRGQHAIVTKAYELQNGTEAVATEKVVSLYSPWQNQGDQFDTNADGKLIPQDVLFVIEEINRRGIRSLTRATDPLFPYIDVDGDGNLFPVDALHVIEEYARQLGAAAIAEGLHGNDEPLPFLGFSSASKLTDTPVGKSHDLVSWTDEVDSLDVDKERARLIEMTRVSNVAKPDLVRADRIAESGDRSDVETDLNSENRRLETS